MRLEDTPVGGMSLEQYWQIGGTWTVDDVPALRAALVMDHGGWVARPLSQIGSATAIHALVEDLSQGDDVTNQTGFALSKFGERALAELMPLLENDEKYRLAAEVIGEMKPLPIAYAATWTVLALDRSEPPAETYRCAARYRRVRPRSRAVQHRPPCTAHEQ